MFKKKFAFGQRIVTVDFKNKLICTDEGEYGSFEQARAIYNIAISDEKPNNWCYQYFGGFNLREYNNRSVRIGCQWGQIEDCKVIIDYIDSYEKLSKFKQWMYRHKI